MTERPEKLSPSQLWGQVRASVSFAAEFPEGSGVGSIQYLWKYV